ncbi:DUF4919 domain-containing protein [candidate division KSB1 bacterium]|nr:DUF4919 domain-containing protein [candidate division KSB1 bacterium]
MSTKKSPNDGPINIFPADFPLNSEPFEVQYQKLKSMDKSLDFYVLRMTYALTEKYNPYDTELRELRERMFKAFSQHDYLKSLQLANAAIDTFCLDIDAHLICLLIYDEWQEEEKKEYYAFFVDGLFKSLLKYGNATNFENAIPVISIHEEYFLLNRVGFKLKTQKLYKHDGRHYDIMTGIIGDDNKKVDLYFDVTIPYTIGSYRLLMSMADKKSKYR